MSLAIVLLGLAASLGIVVFTLLWRLAIAITTGVRNATLSAISYKMVLTVGLLVFVIGLSVKTYQIEMMETSDIWYECVVGKGVQMLFAVSYQLIRGVYEAIAGVWNALCIGFWTCIEEYWNALRLITNMVSYDGIIDIFLTTWRLWICFRQIIFTVPEVYIPVATDLLYKWTNRTMCYYDVFTLDVFPRLLQLTFFGEDCYFCAVLDPSPHHCTLNKPFNVFGYEVDPQCNQCADIICELIHCSVGMWKILTFEFLNDELDILSDSLCCFMNLWKRLFWIFQGFIDNAIHGNGCIDGISGVTDGILDWFLDVVNCIDNLWSDLTANDSAISNFFVLIFAQLFPFIQVIIDSVVKIAESLVASGATDCLAQYPDNCHYEFTCIADGGLQTCVGLLADYWCDPVNDIVILQPACSVGFFFVLPVAVSIIDFVICPTADLISSCFINPGCNTGSDIQKAICILSCPLTVPCWKTIFKPMVQLFNIILAIIGTIEDTVSILEDAIDWINDQIDAICDYLPGVCKKKKEDIETLRRDWFNELSYYNITQDTICGWVLWQNHLLELDIDQTQIGFNIVYRGCNIMYIVGLRHYIESNGTNVNDYLNIVKFMHNIAEVSYAKTSTRKYYSPNPRYKFKYHVTSLFKKIEEYNNNISIYIKEHNTTKEILASGFINRVKQSPYYSITQNLYNDVKNIQKNFSDYRPISDVVPHAADLFNYDGSHKPISNFISKRDENIEYISRDTIQILQDERIAEVYVKYVNDITRQWKVYDKPKRYVYKKRGCSSKTIFSELISTDPLQIGLRNTIPIESPLHDADYRYKRFVDSSKRYELTDLLKANKESTEYIKNVREFISVSSHFINITAYPVRVLAEYFTESDQIILWPHAQQIVALNHTYSTGEWKDWMLYTIGLKGFIKGRGFISLTEYHMEMRSRDLRKPNSLSDYLLYGFSEDAARLNSKQPLLPVEPMVINKNKTLSHIDYFWRWFDSRPRRFYDQAIVNKMRMEAREKEDKRRPSIYNRELAKGTLWSGKVSIGGTNFNVQIEELFDGIIYFFYGPATFIVSTVESLINYWSKLPDVTFESFEDTTLGYLKRLINCSIEAHVTNGPIYSIVCVPLMPLFFWNFIETFPTKYFPMQIPWPDALIDKNYLPSCTSKPFNGDNRFIDFHNPHIISFEFYDTCPLVDSCYRPLCPDCDYQKREYYTCSEIGFGDMLDSVFFVVGASPKIMNEYFNGGFSFQFIFVVGTLIIFVFFVVYTFWTIMGPFLIYFIWCGVIWIAYTLTGSLNTGGGTWFILVLFTFIFVNYIFPTTYSQSDALNTLFYVLLFAGALDFFYDIGDLSTINVMYLVKLGLGTFNHNPLLFFFYLDGMIARADRYDYSDRDIPSEDIFCFFWNFSDAGFAIITTAFVYYIVYTWVLMLWAIIISILQIFMSFYQANENANAVYLSDTVEQNDKRLRNTSYDLNQKIESTKIAMIYSLNAIHMMYNKNNRQTPDIRHNISRAIQEGGIGETELYRISPDLAQTYTPLDTTHLD